MSKESIVLLLGAIVLMTPALGVPNEWKTYIFIGSGVLLLVAGYLLRRAAYYRRIDAGNGMRQTDSFVESAHPDYSLSDDLVHDDDR